VIHLAQDVQKESQKIQNNVKSLAHQQHTPQ